MHLHFIIYFIALITSIQFENTKIIIGIKPNSIDSVLSSLTDLIEDQTQSLTRSLLQRRKSPFEVIEFLEGSLNMAVIEKRFVGKSLNLLKELPGVKFIAKDNLLTAQAVDVQPNPPSYGLARISQRSGIRDNLYTYDENAGAGIDVYVLDSGINHHHEDFGGRAYRAASFVNDESDEDLYGHGTHVSGIVAGRRYGVAKRANVFGVKILNRRGEGSVVQALRAISYVIRMSQRSRRPSIINLSLAGDFNEALNHAVDLASQANIPVIVAAGNQRRDACATSPGSAYGVVVVGNSDVDDHVSRTSNTGRCVTLFAPGSKIRSASNIDRNGEKTLSGTSMAAPHVAGIAALFWASKPELSAFQLYEAIQMSATKNRLIGVPSNTPNLLAFNQLF